MARLDEWLSIINPLVSAGARAPELLDALELDVNAARYLASVAAGAGAGQKSKTRSHIRNLKLNVIRRYLRETLPAREDSVRLQRELAALRLQQREAGYQKRLQKHREREGLIGFDTPVQVPQRPKPSGAVLATTVTPAVKSLYRAVGTPVSDETLMISSARIARDLANAKRTVEIDPKIAKLL